MSKQEMRTLKTGSCPSLSGRSTLTYKIECMNDREVYLCLLDNTGSGIFNKEPVELSHIDALLASAEKPITSGSLQGLFKGKSSNSSGFVLAVLLNERLIRISQGNLRHYECVDQTEFKKTIEELVKLEAQPTHTPPPKTAKKHNQKKESQ